MITSQGRGSSDVGRERKINEDAFFVSDELGLYVVSDGMGGHAAGEIASRIAVEAAVEAVRSEVSVLKGVAGGTEPKAALSELASRAAAAACQRVYSEAMDHPERAGMGCTLMLVLVAGGCGAMAHVGDSRLYLVRGGAVNQLSADHTVAAELAKAGFLRPDEIATHPYAHVLSRCIGTQAAVRVDTLLMELMPGDRLLLCSDGFSNYLNEPASLADSIAGDDLDAASAKLIDQANAGGGRDNITVVLVACEASRPQARRLEAIEKRYEALNNVFLFEDLELPMLARVMELCETETYDAGAVVHEQGNAVNALLVPMSGRFELRTGGRVVEELRPGDHVGASTLLHARGASSTLVAAEPSRLLRLRGQELTKLALARPWLGNRLLERLGRELSVEVARAVTPRPDGPHPGVEKF